MKLRSGGITLEVLDPADAQRLLNAGYVKVEEKPVEIPANPQPEAHEDAAEKPKARKTAMKKGN